MGEVVLEEWEFNISDPITNLKHKRMNVFERIVSHFMNSHICQVCGRKEIWSVSGWLQIDDPRYMDKGGCSVVCRECVRQNPEIFGDIMK